MKKIVLAILDGFGLRDEQNGNAIKGNTPNIDKLNKIINKGGLPRPLFYKKIFNEYELTLLKKIDIY